jgi:GSCFA family
VTANPYTSLPKSAFWRTAVAQSSALDIGPLWSPKFDIAPEDRIITAGSCFAQNIGRALKARGYEWWDAEPAPPMLSEAAAREFNFGIFSFRTGNIYTAALLHQWVAWATGDMVAPSEVWEDDGRYYDPMRPQIEPSGFASQAELLASRAATLKAISRAIRGCKVFVFTLGLTEGWVDRDTGLVYPMCPGTVAGRFDPDRHLFRNFSYPETMAPLSKTLDLCKRINPDIRFLLTVSPVSPTATAEPGEHVLTAASYTKSTLRAVAGDLCKKRADTDYFPGFELITSHPFRAMFFDLNLRTVNPYGIDFVMKHFMSSLSRRSGTEAPVPRAETRSEPRPLDPVEALCDDMILDRYNAA